MQYDALAPIYDRVMSHVDYEDWVELIHKVVARFSRFPNPDIVEIGAGTGVLGSRLTDLGYRYFGSDICYPMIREARSKRDLAVCASDGRHLPFKKQFGVAVFLYDGINYLQNSQDYTTLFQSVYDILLPGGLFLFDITTRENSIRHFTEYLDFEDYGDFSYVRHSYFDEISSIQHNDFTIFKQTQNNPDLYQKFTDNHRQRILSVSAIEKNIPPELFSKVGVWDGYSFKKFTPYSERVHFLLRKNGTA
ncbi:MAG: class I SAM-dependent DNA methyltransferase [Chitinispirillaceae bacterium]